MMHELTGLDHPVIGVRDLNAARIAYERLGFIVPPRGRHPEWGTGNWCIQFERDYLEIRGIIEATAAPQSRELTEFLSRREGLMGIAFATTGAQAAHDSFVRAGLHPKPVKSLTRDFELPSGTVPVAFELCFLPREEIPGLMHVVVCEHRTPELLRRPEWLEHPNGVKRIAGLVVVASQPENLRAPWQKLFGSVETTSGGIRVTVGEGEIVALDPVAAAARYRGVTLPSAGDLPCIAAVVLRVGNLAATRNYFDRQGVDATNADGSIVIGPSKACGALLEFIA